MPLILWKEASFKLCKSQHDGFPPSPRLIFITGFPLDSMLDFRSRYRNHPLDDFHTFNTYLVRNGIEVSWWSVESLSSFWPVYCIHVQRLPCCPVDKIDCFPPGGAGSSDQNINVDASKVVCSPCLSSALSGQTHTKKGHSIATKPANVPKKSTIF